MFVIVVLNHHQATSQNLWFQVHLEFWLYELNISGVWWRILNCKVGAFMWKISGYSYELKAPLFHHFVTFFNQKELLYLRHPIQFTSGVRNIFSNRYILKFFNPMTMNVQAISLIHGKCYFLHCCVREVSSWCDKMFQAFVRHIAMMK